MSGTDNRDNGADAKRTRTIAKSNYWPSSLSYCEPVLVEPPRAFARLVAEQAPGVTVRVLSPGGGALALDPVVTRRGRGG